MSRPHPAGSRRHHNSHLGLLKPVTTDSTDAPSLDAIVVPTARPAKNLRRAMMLANKLDLPLVALCSRQASAEELRLQGKKNSAKVTAVDINQISDKVIPSFKTTDLLSRTEFAYKHDTGTKRNLALLMARMMGWRRIFFLDDDIRVSDPRDLFRAGQLLDRHTAVGLRISKFPDNSVVCHAHRETGGAQRTFIGAGALAVDTTSISSFFPDIYNEDWFFLLDGERLSPVAMTGSARQKRYNPYANQRAWYEEFGDFLAEGVYWQLDTNESVQKAADVQFWKSYLDVRLAFIDDVKSRIGSAAKSAAEKNRMADALDAARARCETIRPELCVEYLRAWHEDRNMWRQHVEKKVADSGLGQPGAELDNVLAALKLL